MAAPPLRLHVPSPDWRDQVLYFVLTDRFADGDPRNNDQGHGEFRRDSAEHYQGGDLAGLRQRLPYIQGLGVSGLWITPPVANQWLSPDGHSAGYHGYWAEDFTRVDPHLGTLRDYQRLSDALHRRGMTLVQDIVVNHTGDYFWYDRTWRADQPAQGWQANAGTPPAAAPRQWPFNLNDPRRAADRAAGIYHWTPNVSDYADPQQVLNGQMSGLDDLNTEQPLVRRVLRQSYAHWVRAVGVDGFRVDTAFYVPETFFTDFLHGRDPAAPGLRSVARRTGRQDFFSFGEGFGIDGPGQDTQTRRIEAYIGPQGLQGMLNFPLYGGLNEVFARGRPTAELGQRIETMMRLHRDPHRLPSFIDNHDVDRFLAGGSEPALRQALLAMLTLPGIPVLYYGTEQGFTAQRASMFAAGHGAGGRDHFDTGSALYRFVQQAVALRRGDRLFSRGRPTVLRTESSGPGALAWRMDHAGRSALVLFNTADHATLLDRLPTGLPPGTVLEGRLGLHGRPARAVVDAQGQLSLALPARAGLVWVGTGRQPAAQAPQGLQIEALPEGLLRGPLSVRGRSDSPLPLQLVLDGDLARALTVQPGADGRWQATLEADDLIDPAQVHRLVAWRAQDGAASAAVTFRHEPAWSAPDALDDPADDDRGPAGRYRYPDDPSFQALRSMDLRRLQWRHAGGALELEITLAGLSRRWNPPNGFDHLALTLFIELPGQPGGSRVMPLQQGELPGELRWHRRLRVHGWSNALFSDEGASATAEGRSITPGALLRSDPATGRITLTLPAAALGRLPSLQGARLYLTTWDYDGGYRPLAPQAQAWAIGGGDPLSDPKVMDDSAVITLR